MAKPDGMKSGGMRPGQDSPDARSPDAPHDGNGGSEGAPAMTGDLSEAHAMTGVSTAAGMPENAMAPATGRDGGADLMQGHAPFDMFAPPAADGQAGLGAAELRTGLDPGSVGMLSGLSEPIGGTGPLMQAGSAAAPAAMAAALAGMPDAGMAAATTGNAAAQETGAPPVRLSGRWSLELSFAPDG